jgi:hypothetical protein
LRYSCSEDSLTVTALAYGLGRCGLGTLGAHTDCLFASGGSASCFFLLLSFFFRFVLLVNDTSMIRSRLAP